MPDKRVTELAAIDTVADLDLFMVIDDPAGTAVNKKATRTQVLVDVAKTNISNTFTGDQTVDGDLFVTGEVNPVVLARQKPKIDLFTGVVGDPAGSRTLLSRSLTSGLSLRHDEDLGARAHLAVGNYDTQSYQPLLIEVESFQVHTGVSPGTRAERVRVHPSGGVTVGTSHTTDPGTGVMRADSLGATPLNANQLLSGTVPLARLPSTMTPTLHGTTHEAGGGDALTALDAGILTGTVADARLSSNVALKGFRNTFTQYQTIAPPPNEPGLLVIRDLSGEGAVLNFTDGSAPADRKTYYMKSQGGGFTIMQANDVGGNISALQWYNGSLFMLSGIHSIYPHGLYFGSSTAMQPADPCIMPAPDTLEFKRYDNTDRVTLLAKGFGNTPLDASQLLSGTVPDARLSANVQMKPVPPPTVSAASRLLGRGAIRAGVMEEIVLGTGLSMTGTTLNAEGGSTLPPTVAYTNVANLFTEDQTVSKAIARLNLKDTAGAVDAKEWRIVANTGALAFNPITDAGGQYGAGAILTLRRTGAAELIGTLTIQRAGGTFVDLRDTTSPVDSRSWLIDTSNGILGIYPATDAGVSQATTVQFFRNGNTEWYSPVTYYDAATYRSTMRVDGSVAVGGIVQVGSATQGSASVGAIRSSGNRLEAVRGDQAVYYPFYCQSIGTYAGGTSLADLTVTGGTNFAGGVLGTSGSFSSAVGIAGKLDVTGGSATVYASAPIEIRMASNPRIGFHWPAVVASQIGMDSAGTIRTFDNPGTGYAPFAAASVSTTGNVMCGGNLHCTLAMSIRGTSLRVVGIRGAWYLASHSSYGLYCNTGMYCAGDVWASGVSVAGSLAGKHPLMTASGGLGAIGLQYGTQSAIHALLTQVAAPAGGTGTAAGGWSTGANRDARHCLDQRCENGHHQHQGRDELSSSTSLKNMGILAVP